MQEILYFDEKSRKSPILSMKKLLYFAQKLNISPIFSKIPFSYISDFGRYHPCAMYYSYVSYVSFDRKGRVEW